jgi:hypothetical protein
VTGSKRSVFKMIGDFSEYLKDIIIWDKGVSQPAMQELVLKRNYIGSEINKTYIDISDDRLGNSGQMWIF